MIIPNKNKTPILPVIKAIGKSPRTVIKKKSDLLKERHVKWQKDDNGNYIKQCSQGK